MCNTNNKTTKELKKELAGWKTLSHFFSEFSDHYPEESFNICLFLLKTSQKNVEEELEKRNMMVNTINSVIEKFNDSKDCRQ